MAEVQWRRCSGGGAVAEVQWLRCSGGGAAVAEVQWRARCSGLCLWCDHLTGPSVACAARQ